MDAPTNTRSGAAESQSGLSTLHPSAASHKRQQVSGEPKKSTYMCPVALKMRAHDAELLDAHPQKLLACGASCSARHSPVA